jgi:putative flippase GtrA
MNDLTRRPRRRLSRQTREQRAYRLVVVGGAATAIAAVGFVLALVGVMGFGVPILAAIVAVICGLVMRRTLSR